MKQELIDKIQAKTHAIENNGTLEQLNEVLKACFLKDIDAWCLPPLKFVVRKNSPLGWEISNKTTLPTIKVTEFFEKHTLESLLERIEALEILLKAQGEVIKNLQGSTAEQKLEQIKAILL